jgi:excinuclease ABC subunit B
MVFKLSNHYTPAGDQPKAIEALVKSLEAGNRHQTLLGVTGSGKTFTAANLIAHFNKPTLVIAHNKTLAAQLASEYRDFFPDAAVHYFVSYYDYYQPEAYVPTSDTYIEKESQVNEDIERLRHAATQALLTRPDTIIVASVSCIYGLGSPEEYIKVHLKLTVGEAMTRADLVRKLIAIYFERMEGDLSPGTFSALGNSIEIIPANERTMYKVDLAEGRVVRIIEIDPLSRQVSTEHNDIFIFPAKHYVTPENVQNAAVADIAEELKEQLVVFDTEKKILEADRLKRRTRQDIALIKEFGFCSGIENYSMHFDRRSPGEPPFTLLDYFPHKEDGTPDFLTIIDESHVTLPQIGGMYAGDRSRKQMLIEHGFRLPSALDNRPLRFEEFEKEVGQCVYTSATPGKYEFEHCPTMVQQIIRPTGLVDPLITVLPVSEGPGYKGQVFHFIDDAIATAKRDARSLVTVLTKKMAEDLSVFLVEKGVKAKYIHSDVKTIERIEILTDFRRGVFDVLVGVNLLREGLDLPEVELVAILDADKEGFLRSDTSLIQTIGRAARNVAGRVTLYADGMTGSLERSIGETNRRREIQIAHNLKHGITPQTIKKKIADITGDIQKQRAKALTRLVDLESSLGGVDIQKLKKQKEKEMHDAADRLDFETAALLRDELRMLEEKFGEKAQKKAASAAKKVAAASKKQVRISKPSA